MTEVAEKQDGEQQQQQQEPGEQKTFTQAEWDARQKDFDAKAGKIRRNAAREAELRFRRDQDAQRGQGQQQEQTQQQAREAELKEPKRDDFQDYESYADARADYVGRKAAREERAKAVQEEGERKAAESDQQANQAFRKHLESVVAEIPDFEELLDAANEDNLQMPSDMGRAIREAGVVGAHMLKHLLENRDELARIAGLTTPESRVRALTRLETKIEAELEAAKKEGENDSEIEDGDGRQDEEQPNKADKRDGADESERDGGGRFKAQDEKQTRRKAPDPIEPVAGRGGNNSAQPSDKDSDAVWLEKRNAEVARERQGMRRRAG